LAYEKIDFIHKKGKPILQYSIFFEQNLNKPKQELQLRSGRRDTGGQPLGATAARPHSLPRKSLSQAQHMILPVFAVRPGISVTAYQGPLLSR
jgi:hypothetical protein